jgi:hypothetical protein
VADVLRRLGAAAVATALAGAVTFAAPTAGHASNGLFLWTDGSSGLVTPIAFPPQEKCFGTFHANRAQNWTDTDAVLSKDGLCFDMLTVVKPGQSYDGEFGSVGFVPPGATNG